MWRLPPEVPTLWLLSDADRISWQRRVVSADDSEIPVLSAAQDLYCMPEFEAWARYFFPHYLTLPCSKMHRFLIHHLQRQHLIRGQRRAIVAPRGGAKTSWTTKLYALYQTCHGLEPYHLLVAETEKQTKKNLRAIQLELESNRELARYYPHVCGKGPVWNTTEMETANGFKIEAFGSGCAGRGTSFKEYRPSLITVDDLLSDDVARSGTQRDQVTEWFMNALLPMGNRETNVWFVGTALHRDDTLQRLGDPSKIPGWEFQTFKALVKEPSRQDLWDEWRRLFRDPTDAHRTSTARSFYQANEAEMLKGAELLWPEHESLYDLMVYRNSNGEHSFQSEKQGNATAASNAEWPDECFPANIWFDHWPQLQLRVIALDPSKGKTDTSDFSAFILLGLGLDGVLYVDADIERRDLTRIVEDGFTLAADFQPSAFSIETNQFQELLQVEFERISRERAIILPIVGVNNMSKKEIRIRTLGPYIRSNRFRFKSNSKGATRLVEQLREFPHASHDDGPDALEQAIKAMQYLIGGESQRVDDEQWSP